MKMDTPVGAKSASGPRDNSFRPPARNERPSHGGQRGAPQQPSGQSAMAAAFAKLQTKR
jgi:uncharacterized protein